MLAFEWQPQEMGVSVPFGRVGPRADFAEA